jgi:predicted dehydrogenase
MSGGKIRVGIVGAGGWTKYGHIPALKALDEFEIVAVSNRKKEKAEETAKQFHIKHAFGDEQSLISHPDVDLVSVVAPAPEHARLVKQAIAAGKDVYSEWPLTTSTAQSEELLSLAERKGVRHIVGLQRRMGPSARYTRDLIKQGYVGKIRGVHMTVSADAFVPEMPAMYSWAFDAANFSNILSIYTAHFGDMLFNSVGFPKRLTAVIETQFPFFTVVETGEQVRNTNPNEVMVIGTLEDGGLFSMQVEGAQKHRTGVQIDISGTEGVLRITNSLAFQNKDDNAIEGMNGDAQTFSPRPVPEKYQPLAKSGLDVSVQDLAYLYSAYAGDKVKGTSEASNFRDAVRQHRLIDEIYRKSAAFFEKVSVNA